MNEKSSYVRMGISFTAGVLSFLLFFLLMGRLPVTSGFQTRQWEAIERDGKMMLRTEAAPSMIPLSGLDLILSVEGEAPPLFVRTPDGVDRRIEGRRGEVDRMTRRERTIEYRLEEPLPVREGERLELLIKNEGGTEAMIPLRLRYQTDWRGTIRVMLARAAVWEAPLTAYVFWLSFLTALFLGLFMALLSGVRS